MAKPKTLAGYPRAVEVQRLAVQDRFDDYFFLFHSWDESQIVKRGVGDTIPNSSEFLGVDPEDGQLLFRDILPRPRTLLDLDSVIEVAALSPRSTRLHYGLLQKLMNFSREEYMELGITDVYWLADSVFTSEIEKQWYYNNRQFRLVKPRVKSTGIIFRIRILDKKTDTYYVRYSSENDLRRENSLILEYREKVREKTERLQRRGGEYIDQTGWGAINLFQRPEEPPKLSLKEELARSKKWRLKRQKNKQRRVNGNVHNSGTV